MRSVIKAIVQRQTLKEDDDDAWRQIIESRSRKLWRQQKRTTEGSSGFLGAESLQSSE